ncbi:hypothetical protein QYE76_033448 [Lolium multiflorum]|uniref:Integrase catalytic domain-containing protein n=1 Tax=Lolium multiflorum TaxID=4521 RepID=A0AAD8QWN8_LOLMU|nr:hypothetical protein QYE76_033448 [Lolium multiflorum]
MIREGESVADAYARLGALRVRVKGLGVEKYNDGFEMNEAFIKSKVIAMIAVKQEDTNLALNLQIMTKSADLNSDDLVSYVAANENMAKAGKRLKAMNRVDEASHNHEASHNLALKARADHGGEEEYEIEEDEEMTSTSDIATDFAFFAKKYKGKNKVKDLETIERAQLLAQELDASKKELEVAHASLTRDLDHLEKANKLVKDELKKLGENHDLLQETYKKALGSLNDPIAKMLLVPLLHLLVSMLNLLRNMFVYKRNLYVETNAYLESLVTKYGLNYYPNDSACEQATILEENARLTKELAKFTTAKNKMGLDDLLSKQRSNNQKFGLGYVPKPYKKKNYKKEKPAQEKNKKVTSNGKASKGKATSGDRTGPNNHYALFVDYYGDVYAEYVGPRNGYAYRGVVLELGAIVGPNCLDLGFIYPQQNGVVERKNRTIIEMARTMLSEFNSPHNFWGEAISTAVHYSNRLFLRPLHNKTPYELLTGNKPNVMYIRVFGCKCLVKNNKGKLGKFETRTIEGTFVGYAENSHAYRYYNKSTGAIEVSCDVVFLEDNGSQVEQVVPCAAGDDDPSNAIKLMGIGHIRPTEVHIDDQDDGIEVSSSPQVEPSSTQVEPSSATQDASSTQDEPHPEEQEESPQPTEQDHDDDQETSSTHVQAQVVPHDQVLARDEFIDHEGTIRKIKAATRASDMKVDQVLGSISRGVVTRRHHALLITYCQHHGCVSSFPSERNQGLIEPGGAKKHVEG